MDEATRNTLDRVGRGLGTPCYVYFLDPVLREAERLVRAFRGRFAVSYAIKSNPNPGLLRHLRAGVGLVDASSAGEVDLALRAGYPPEAISFSGPAKRGFELERALDAGPVEMVCESWAELAELDALAGARGLRVPVLLRINPARVPRSFGVNMGGKPSPFGIDEEDLGGVLDRLPGLTSLDHRGFHVYSGTNSLSEDAISENMGIFVELFERFSDSHDLRPRKLIFGAGFGIPYSDDKAPLDLERLASLVNPRLDALALHPRLLDAACVLELGRFLVGPHGYFLTSVVGEKASRGVEVRICDGGMNNHMAACGLMGMVIRRNWPMWKVNREAADVPKPYLITGPLCTTIDTLGSQVLLPELRRGDVIAVGSSGAYGLTSSPTRFISHPDPKEYLVLGSGDDAEILDVTGPGDLGAEHAGADPAGFRGRGAGAVPPPNGP